jgi:hypothetical protein
VGQATAVFLPQSLPQPLEPIYKQLLDDGVTFDAVQHWGHMTGRKRAFAAERIWRFPRVPQPHLQQKGIGGQH